MYIKLHMLIVWKKNFKKNSNIGNQVACGGSEPQFYIKLYPLQHK
jgi:hypothetical protein